MRKKNFLKRSDFKIDQFGEAQGDCKTTTKIWRGSIRKYENYPNPTKKLLQNFKPFLQY